MHVYVPAMVSPSREVTTTKGISSIPLNYFLIELDKYFNVAYEYLQEWLQVFRLQPPPILRR